MSDWNSIKSAPRDGTQILLAEPGSRGWVLYMGCWIDVPIWYEGVGIRTWPRGWTSACVAVGDRGPFETERYYWRPKQVIVLPSHWMPVPQPPPIRVSRALSSAMKAYDRFRALGDTPSK